MEQATKKSTESYTLKGMTCVPMGIVCPCDTLVDTCNQARNAICSAALVFRQNPAFSALNLSHVSTPSRYSRLSAPPSQVNFFKKFLLQKHRFIAGSFHENSTNFGKCGAIFHQNTAVSCAATSSTECQMLRLNRTAISRFVPTSVCANAAHRSTTSAFHLHTVVGLR
ncbi:hypothetical protein [Aquitalea magnusonii]|uniref:hypothetical protein n=1 Tax=Aquitalea magnusonii TaxID=332411 RepID=UPI0011AE4B65|nr:hypothetical protein [Aquitalea magnusonii]